MFCHKTLKNACSETGYVPEGMTEVGWMDQRNRVGVRRRNIGVGRRYVGANRRYIRTNRRCVRVGMDVTLGYQTERQIGQCAHRSVALQDR